MQKAIETNNATKGMDLKNGKRHYDSNGNPLGGIKAKVINSDNQQIEVEMGEVIITRDAVSNPKKYKIEGTTKEILSTLNQEGGGVPINETEAEILAKYKDGGKIPREKHKLYLGKEGGSNVSEKGAFEIAVDMESKGIDNETIRSITGWFRSELDGLWRYEISDKEMEIICTFTDEEIASLKTDEDYFYKDLKDVIKHEELFKAYPRIKYLRVFFMNVDDKPEASLCTTEKGKIFIICNLKYERAFSNNKRGAEELGEREISDNRRSGKERAKRYNTLHFRKVIAHELQHAIQINEGLAEGGNPNFELKKLKANSGTLHNLTEAEQKRIATQRYLNKAGEIEARSSDARIDLDELQRSLKKPYSEIAIDKKYFSSDLETKIKFDEGGELIKRADGSYSRRGLYDNIRDNIGSGMKPTKQMLEQEAKIKEKYHLGGDMSKHLAPNGKPSNLTHEQWHLVREPAFISWFGDWINSPETASKVVDENGEPLVVWHGTNEKFTVFGKDKNKSILPEYKEEYSYKEKTHYFHKSKKYAKTFGSKYGGYEKSYFLNIKNIEKVDEDTIEDIGYFKNIYDYYVNVEGVDGIFSESGQYATLLSPNQIKLADGSNTTFDANNDDIRYKQGGNISKMTPSELKEFYASPEGKKLDAQTYSEWKKLVNMSKSELENFYNSVEGKKAGLSQSEAKEQGIDSGRESARWIIKMKDIPYTKWTSNMWRWAKKQINFIKRMSGMKGGLYDDNGNKTRKHTALLIWGHNPETKFAKGGGVPKDAFEKSENERNEDYEGNWNLWIDTLLKNIDLPIEWTTSESRKELYGDSFYITIFNEDWQEFAKLRFSGHSVTNTSRLQNEFHNPNISRFYEIVSRAMNQKQQEENPEELIKFKGGGVISQKALAVETTDLKDYVRKYFVKDGRIDVSDAMQEMFGNKRGKSTHAEYQKRIGLHKKGGLTISELAHKLWEEHKDEVRGNIDDSDFREAVEDVISSEYGVSSMIKSLMEKSDEGIEDEEAKYWASQFDENEYNPNDEQLTDEEMSMIFRDMEQAERELAKGTEHEMEHLDTLKKVAEHKITPEEAVVETAQKHISENKNYYEDLEKMELNELLDKLKKQGYNVTIPSGDNRISVMGYGKGYFKAKKQMAKSIIETLKANGYNAVSELDSDGYYDFWVYPSEQQDLAKTEKENKNETYTYALTLRPFGIGTYPIENFIRLVEEQDNNYRFGLLEYSKPLSDIDIKHYSLAPVSELLKYDGVTFDYFLGNLGKANIKKTKGNIPYVDVDLYDKDTNELVETYDISGEEFLRNIGKDWRIVGEQSENEESIPDLIEGLKVLLEYTEGAEKTELENTIEGLKLLLDDDKFAEGGELNNNSMFFEPSKSDEEEEKTIMENQFGKNI